MLIQLHKLLDVAQCYDLLRQVRWSQGVVCPNCASQQTLKNGKDVVQIHCQHDKCKACGTSFDDLTDTVFSGSHQGVHQWLTVLYMMNLNGSMAPVAAELDISEMTAQSMCAAIGEGVVKKPVPVLSGSLEADECYVVAGHKGQPVKVRESGRKSRPRRLKGKRGRGASADEKNPVFGMVEREGLVCLRVLPNVKQQTIRLVIDSCANKGSVFNTDEYNIYNKLAAWGYAPKVVNHGQGEYARDEDGDGFYEVHCTTQEGVWSLLRSWLGPHRGVSQEKLPFYVGFFEWIHTLRKRGKKALHETFCLLLTPDLRTYDECLIVSPI